MSVSFVSDIERRELQCLTVDGTRRRKSRRDELRTGEKVEIIYALIALAVASKPVIDTYIEILIAKGCLRASRTDRTCAERQLL